jgi:hypothetical protein
MNDSGDYVEQSVSMKNAVESHTHTQIYSYLAINIKPLSRLNTAAH